MKKLLVAGFLLGLTGCFPMYTMERSTVMITNLAGNSGGSGVIIGSNKALTNAHVCEVVKQGGLVHTADAAHVVLGYQQSQLHDICAITVAGDLGLAAKISNNPEILFEKSTVSGHPRLLPTIVNHGHFTSHSIIKVMTGIRNCTIEELEDPFLGMICAMLGKLPIIKNYEATTLSNLIQPGSSGSPVFGEDSRLKALVFAGSGELSYGYAVPYAYIVNFMHKELSTLEVKRPDMTMNFLDASRALRNWKNKFQDLCEKSLDVAMCKDVKNSIILEVETK